MVIRLFCAAGMSTSVLVKKMQEAAKEKGKDADIAIFSGKPMEVFTRTLYTIIDGNITF